MGIKVLRTIRPDSNRIIVEVSGEDDIELFWVLIDRAMRTWDQAPARIKTMADEIRFGVAQQDYSVQRHKARPE